jgi:hypothetical protein
MDEDSTSAGACHIGPGSSGRFENAPVSSAQFDHGRLYVKLTTPALSVDKQAAAADPGEKMGSRL